MCRVVLYGSGYEYHCTIYHPELLNAKKYLLAPLKQDDGASNNPSTKLEECKLESEEKVKEEQTEKMATSRGESVSNILNSRPGVGKIGMKLKYPTLENTIIKKQIDLLKQNKSEKTGQRRADSQSHAELLATLSQFPASPWSGLVTQAARKSREVDAAMVHSLRIANPPTRYCYSGDSQMDSLPTKRFNHAYSELKKRLLFTAAATSLGFYKTVQHLSRSVKVTKCLLNRFRLTLTPLELAVVEKQLSLQEHQLNQVCSKPPMANSLTKLVRKPSPEKTGKTIAFSKPILSPSLSQSLPSSMKLSMPSATPPQRKLVRVLSQSGKTPMTLIYQSSGQEAGDRMRRAGWMDASTANSSLFHGHQGSILPLKEEFEFDEKKLNFSKDDL